MKDCCEKKHEKMHDMKYEKHKMDSREEEMWQRLYPDSYMCIHMAMEHHCEAMEKEKGKHHIPDRDEFEKMIDGVLEEVEDEMKYMGECENENMNENKDDDDSDDRDYEYSDDRDDEDEDNDMKRFTPYGGRRRRRRRRLNRDLLGLLLLGQLYGRRRPYPPYYPPRPYPPPHVPYGGPY